MVKHTPKTPTTPKPTIVPLKRETPNSPPQKREKAHQPEPFRGGGRPPKK